MSGHGNRAHAEYSASGAKRWLTCPGSIQLAQEAPEQVESVYAKEGTTAHECLEFLLCNANKLKTAKNAALKQWPKEMVEHAMEAVGYVQTRMKEFKDPTLVIEEKIDISELVDPDEELFGTLDIGIVALKEKKLLIADYKYGAGIAVDPEENEQLIYYALGLAKNYGFKFKTVELIVIQPRAFHESGETIRSWETSMEEIEAWAFNFAIGVAESKEDKPPLKAGEHCRFCPAAVTCPEVSKNAMAEAQIVFDDMDAKIESLPEVSELKNLPNILEACKKLESWITKVREYAYNHAYHGGTIEGWKLVWKHPRRKWVGDEDKLLDEAEKNWSGLAVQKKLISPAQFEKTMTGEKGRKWLEENCVKESSGLTLVPIKDKREAVNPVNEVFAAIEAE